jgi:hypothetical protein
MSFRPSQVRFTNEGWGQQDLEGEQPNVSGEGDGGGTVDVVTRYFTATTGELE